jgi:hypothetical protein
MGPRIITVFGATGFLGRHIVRRLHARGCVVRIASRHPDQARHSSGPMIRTSDRCRKVSISRICTVRCIATRCAREANIANPVDRALRAARASHAQAEPRSCQTRLLACQRASASRGRQRYALDGTPVGPVLAEHHALAAAQIQEIEARGEAKGSVTNSGPGRIDRAIRPVYHAHPARQSRSSICRGPANLRGSPRQSD